MAQAWDFFSSPLNLAKITPPDMSFFAKSFQFFGAVLADFLRPVRVGQ
jgi:hypothetical protein